MLLLLLLLRLLLILLLLLLLMLLLLLLLILLLLLLLPSGHLCWLLLSGECERSGGGAVRAAVPQGQGVRSTVLYVLPVPCCCPAAPAYYVPYMPICPDCGSRPVCGYS